VLVMCGFRHYSFNVANPKGFTMYDMSQPNSKPGECVKCRGTGVYSFGGTVNGKPRKSGTCYSCRGTGKQDTAQIHRNHTYNKFKVMRIGL